MFGSVRFLDRPGSSDLQPDFTDMAPDPDPIQLSQLLIFLKIYRYHMTDKKFSPSPTKSTYHKSAKKEIRAGSV
jgi:hypothetical protein